MTISVFSLNRRRFVQGAGLTAASMMLGGLPEAYAQTKGGTVVIGHTTLRHLNPAIQSGQATGIPGTQIFAGLTQLNDKFEAQPYLAKSWEVSPDGLTYTFHLEENAVFHDGKPITSEDVAFSLDVVKANHPFGKPMFGTVKAVETPDAKTARFVLERPHPALMSALSPLLLPILPKHVYGEGDIRENPANLKPVGSGPFKFSEYRPGEVLVLDRNENFFRPGRPYLDRLIFRITQDPVVNVLGLERGDINYLPFALVRVSDIDRLKANENLTVTTDGYEAFGATNYLEFNLRHAPLDDVRVRKAIAHAVDKDFIQNKILAGHAKRLDGPLTESSPFYSAESLKKYELDLEKAKALLDEAGHPVKDGGMRFSLTLEWLPDANINSQQPVAQYLKAQLRQIGIDIVLRPNPDFGSFATRIGNWEHQLTMNGIWNYPDPVIGVNRAYLSTNQKKGAIFTNTEGYVNPRVDELMIAAGGESDPAKRKELYAEFQAILTDELPLLWTNEEPLFTLYDKKLQGLPLTVWGALAPYDEMHWA
ncbi:ABC transporter substrate-binding protein [Pseudaminobacter arsenicus]|uniref:ABC transporter substrate-binding protein n=1 Tax=Borborobacter arsenicus TaxID=1851146 RepID=A0A432VBI5_9HYPH|nr:ABC transporter substrate-binding protein [Pseudaminobacter arsenicus]RUM99532.1 ABC transporter substrate-binding protein [Pseudaminobacter arsenicus]